MKVFSAPEKVTINITNRCNLNCLYCGVSTTKNAPGDLSLEEWGRVIDELSRIKVFKILISGGEPFIRNDFSEILEHILKHHFRISINTNGTLLDDKVLSLISQSRRLENIQISVDGPKSDIHDFIRGNGTFDKIQDGIKILRRMNTPFTFFIVVCRNNKDCLGEMVEFARSAGASQITFSSLLPQGSALDHLDDLFLTFEEEKEVENEMRILNKKYPSLVGGSLVQGIRMMDRISQIDVSDLSPSTARRITSCGGSVTECSIRPEGWVIPCDRLWDYRVGNVKDETFQDIWLHSEGFRQFRMRYSRTMDSFDECQGCQYTPVCKGGCPAVPYNMGKGIEGWDPHSCYRVFTGEKESYI